MQVKLSNLILGALILSLFVGVGSWKASAYVTEVQRMQQELVTLKQENTDLRKELDKCHNALTNWRPGAPIGNPAGGTGSPTPLGSPAK